MKILVIEDDAATAAYIARALAEHGHVVDLAATGRDGVFLAGGGAHDVLIVDRMLPGLDGLGLEGPAGDRAVTPVLFLTALGGVGDRVRGLDAGGDDYLVKPFGFPELLARRPPLVLVQTMLRVADLEMDLLKRTVMRHAERVVTRTMLLEAVWDSHFGRRTNIVETHISRLRAKLARDGAPDLIHTVRGAGYLMRGASVTPDAS